MLDKELIIPLPSGSEVQVMRGETKAVIGLYPCFGGCHQYGLVKLDNSGNPYVACSPHEITHKGGCGRTYGKKEHLPVQTVEVYRERFALLNKSLPLPDAYTRYLEHAWSVHDQQEGDGNECGTEPDSQ